MARVVIARRLLPLAQIAFVKKSAMKVSVDPSVSRGVIASTCVTEITITIIEALKSGDPELTLMLGGSI